MQTLLRLVLLEITFFLSPDFHELWCSVMSTCLFTEVKQQWAMYRAGRPHQCTTCVSDGFAACTNRPKPLSALFI